MMNTLQRLVDKYWYGQDRNVKMRLGLGLLATVSTIGYMSLKFIVNKPKIYKKIMDIEIFIENEIWYRDYCFQLLGCIFYARCTMIKLSNNKYLIHSPSPIDDIWINFIKQDNKEIEYIVAPGNYHYLHTVSWINHFANAKVLIAPGIETKASNLSSDCIYGILHDNYVDHDVNSVLNKDFEFVLVRGSNEMNEVSMYHKKSSTLILVDSFEYVTPKYYNYMNRMNHIFWYMYGLHNKPHPSPTYFMTVKNKHLAKQSFEKILKWDFDKILINHGQNVNPKKDNMNANMSTQDAINQCKQLCKKCWHEYL